MLMSHTLCCRPIEHKNLTVYSQHNMRANFKHIQYRRLSLSVLKGLFMRVHYPTLRNIVYSCTQDREILRFIPCEKFLSHPRYLTPVAPCVQVFFFNIGCKGRHVIPSLSAYITMTSKRFKSKWRTPRLKHFLLK